MELGVQFPTEELGMDSAAIRDFIQGAEGLGYRHAVVGEHVIGSDPASRAGQETRYTNETLYHEPLTFLSYLAACTKDMLLVSTVLILPMRQTVLVAKQCAEIDCLSGGRLRLGIGVGRNPVEYEALGQDFHTRGRRIEEQVALLRELWTKPVVTFEGRWEKITEAGLNPLPVQRPIPIWFGGTTDTVLKRTARLGDGWIPTGATAEGAFDATLNQVRGYLRDAGRDISTFAIAGRTNAGKGSPDEWRKAYADWQRWGASTLAVDVTAPGVTKPDQMLDVLRRYKEAVS